MLKRPVFAFPFPLITNTRRNTNCLLNKTRWRTETILLVFFTLTLFTNLASAALDVDNGVLGTPEVECERDFVHFKVATKKAFRGRVYVKGEFDNPKCVQTIGHGNAGREEETTTEGNSGHNSKTGEEPDESTPESAAKRVGAGVNLESGKEGKKASSKGTGGRKFATGSQVPEGEEEEEQQTVVDNRKTGEEGDEEEEAIRQILQELQKRRNGNQDKAQRNIPSHLPGFASAEQPLKRWRSFLGGKQGLDGQGFRRYGSKLSPDANGECPIVCPPCEDCAKEVRNEVLKRKRRLTDHHAELRVPLSECRTIQRDRMLLIHPYHFYITRVDRAYNIQCAYQEPERMLSTQIDVSPPPIIQISNQMPTPQCEYRVHGQTTADQVRNVQVGDTVEHEWSCHGAEQSGGQQDDGQRMAALFGLLVHDCFVDDGKSRRAQVVDSRGCSLEPLILPTPVYSVPSNGDLPATYSLHIQADTLRANVNANVAKFPDGDLIGFQCSITVCMRELGRCDGITPPDCSGPSALNSDPFSMDSSNVTREKRASEEGAEAMDWELHSPMMTVFDLSDQVEGSQEAFNQQQPIVQRPIVQKRSFCVSVPMFAAFCCVGTFLSTLSTGALIITLLYRGGFSEVLQKKY